MSHTTKTCPQCGASVGCYDTRQKGEVRYRRYLCDSGHRYTTAEIPVGDVSFGDAVLRMQYAINPPDESEVGARIKECIASLERVHTKLRYAVKP